MGKILEDEKSDRCEERTAAAHILHSTSNIKIVRCSDGGIPGCTQLHRQFPQAQCIALELV